MSEHKVARQNIQPSGLFKRMLGGHTLYSHVVSVPPGRFVFISGQLARDSEGNVVGRGDMERQVRQVVANIRCALKAAGASLSDLVHTTTYVTDIDAFFACVDARMELFAPGMPTSTTVEVRRLSHPDFMVEIDAVAIVRDSEKR